MDIVEGKIEGYLKGLEGLFSKCRKPDFDPQCPVLPEKPRTTPEDRLSEHCVKKKNGAREIDTIKIVCWTKNPSRGE